MSQVRSSFARSGSMTNADKAYDYALKHNDGKSASYWPWNVVVSENTGWLEDTGRGHDPTRQLWKFPAPRKPYLEPIPGRNEAGKVDLSRYSITADKFRCYKSVYLETWIWLLVPKTKSSEVVRDSVHLLLRSSRKGEIRPNVPEVDAASGAILPQRPKPGLANGKGELIRRVPLETPTSGPMTPTKYTVRYSQNPATPQGGPHLARLGRFPNLKRPEQAASRYRGPL